MLNIEAEIKTLGTQILEEAQKQTPSIFNKNWWNGKILEYCMKHKAFKLEMFRFVDVFPALHTDDQIKKHIEEYFNRPGLRVPTVLQLGILAAQGITSGLALAALKKNIHNMAKIFIAGENPEDALNNLKKLWNEGVAFTTDLLGEKAVSEREASAHQAHYLELLDTLVQETKKWPSNTTLENTHEGSIPRVNISIKISALYSQLNPLDFEESISTLKNRLRPLFQKALAHNVTLYLDMEHYALKDLTLTLFKSLLEEKEFASFAHAGIVLQAYLKETEDDLKNLISWCEKQNKKIYVRLVKGAYWDHENIHAKLYNWPVPVFSKKESSDANYEKLAILLLKNSHLIRPAFASHNVRSIAHALVYAQTLDLPKNAVEVQMLYGMAEPIKKVLVNMGYRVRDYTPIGELIPGMAYLVRRLLENTSNESFLRQSFVDAESLDKLLKKPELGVTE